VACREARAWYLTSIKERQYFAVSQSSTSVTGGRKPKSLVFLEKVFNSIIGRKRFNKRFSPVRRTIIRDNYLKLVGRQGFIPECF